MAALLSRYEQETEEYAVLNDDCTPELVPHISDWNCANNEADVVMSCGPLDAVGIEVLPGASRLDVRICPFSESPGSSPLHILWQGTSTPNPG